MGVMGSSARMVLALVLILALVCCTSAQFAGYDGRPRPKSMTDQPTDTLGAKPAVKYKGQPANCIWYDWENPNYSLKDTNNCSSLLWASLNADPSSLVAYTYYFADIFYVPDYNEYLCVIGCFDLSATSPAPSTSAPPAVAPVVATPPVTSSPPVTPPAMSSPPVTPPVMSPPPSTPAVAPAVPPTTPPSTPPPMMAPPPPATLFRPPPPGLPLPPSSIVAPTTGPSEAAGPPTQASAGSALRIFPAASILVLSAAVFGLTF